MFVLHFGEAILLRKILHIVQLSDCPIVTNCKDFPKNPKVLEKDADIYSTDR